MLLKTNEMDEKEHETAEKNEPQDEVTTSESLPSEETATRRRSHRDRAATWANSETHQPKIPDSRIFQSARDLQDGGGSSLSTFSSNATSYSQLDLDDSSTSNAAVLPPPGSTQFRNFETIKYLTSSSPSVILSSNSWNPRPSKQQIPPTNRQHHFQRETASRGPSGIGYEGVPISQAGWGNQSPPAAVVHRPSHHAIQMDDEQWHQAPYGFGRPFPEDSHPAPETAMHPPEFNPFRGYLPAKSVEILEEHSRKLKQNARMRVPIPNYKRPRRFKRKWTACLICAAIWVVVIVITYWLMYPH